jgi:phage terminase small subunit
MPAGRPRKPIPIRATEGDTRKLGSRRHQEAIEAAHRARPGVPEPPATLKGMALEHYEYLADGLLAEGLIALIDQGALVSAATAFEVMMRAHEEKRFRDWAEATKLYMQIADRLGLHESARAKFTKKDVSADPIGEAMCG